MENPVELHTVRHPRTRATHFARPDKNQSLCGLYVFDRRIELFTYTEDVTCQKCTVKKAMMYADRLVQPDPDNPIIYVTTTTVYHRDRRVTCTHYTLNGKRGICGNNIAGLPTEPMTETNALATCVQCLAHPEIPARFGSDAARARMSARGRYDRTLYRNDERPTRPTDDTIIE